jgi:hypothetical protein
LACCLLVAGLCLGKGVANWLSLRQGTGKQPGTELAQVPIEDVRCGHRVAPEQLPAGEYVPPGEQIDPATTRELVLRAPKTDGGWADVTALYSLAALEKAHAAVGGTMPISVRECGIAGRARILEIRACPAIAPGTGPVVTATYRHAVAKLLRVYLAGQPKPLGVTPNHRFKSLDRQAFVRADELRLGERLDGYAEARVARVEDRGDPALVYNLQVNGTHVYRVGQAGVLVHNGGNTLLPFPADLELGLGQNGIIYVIEGVLNGQAQNYIGSTYDPYRFFKQHAMRDLLQNGENVRVQVTPVDISDAAALAEQQGISESRAAKQLLRTSEQLQLQDTLGLGGEPGDTVNGVTNRNGLWPVKQGRFPAFRQTYGDRRGALRDVTNKILQLDCPP